MRRCYLHQWGYFLSYEINNFSVRFGERRVYCTLNLFLCTVFSAVKINCYRALKLPTRWFFIFDIFFVTWSQGVVCSNNVILTYLVLDCLQAWPCELPLNFDTEVTLLTHRTAFEFVFSKPLLMSHKFSTNNHIST